MKPQNAEKIIYKLIKNKVAMEINQIYYELSDLKGFSERVIKETIIKLREQGKIEPNKQWKMVIKKH